MAVDQTSLIQSIYDTVFSSFVYPPRAGQPNTQREIVLSLEWPGQQIDISQYANPWLPQNPTGSQFATEMFSTLVDAVPLLDAVYVDSGVTVEELYEFVLGAVATPLPADANGEVPANPVNTTLQNARQIFEQSKLASALHPALSYRASYASPTNWYDEAASQSWTQITINANQTQTMPNSPFVRTGGLKRAKDGLWKLPERVVKPDILVKNDVIKQVSIRPDVLSQAVLSNKTLVNLQVLKPAMMRSLMAQPMMSRSILQAQTLQQITPNPLLVKRIRPELLDKVDLVAVKDQNIDQQTKDLQISFRCCRVNVNRPWLMKSLLDVKGWTLPGQAPGSLSTGTLENNTGSFPLLPISFIAIRDLKIRANWSKQDAERAARATSTQETVGFGPFALSGSYAESGKVYTSSFDGITLSASGLQILGWISLVLPFTPPV